MSYNYIIYASIDAPSMAINPWNLMWRLLVPAKLYEMVIGSVLFRYVIGILQFLVYIVVAIIFGATFNINIISAIIVIILGVAVMWGLGMISAGIQVITKRWDPVTWFFYNAWKLVIRGMETIPIITSITADYIKNSSPNIYFRNVETSYAEKRAYNRYD